MAFPKLDDIISAVVDNVNKDEPLAQAPDAAPSEVPQELPEPVQQAQAPEAAETPVEPQEQKILDLKDLVKDGKFKFEDREFTLDELKKNLLRQSDYTKKMQEIAATKKEFEAQKQEAKYWDNLQHDLSMVKQYPNLVSKFKETYPAKFHSFVAEFEEQPSEQSGISKSQILQEVQALISKEINPLRESVTEREKAATIAQWQAWDTQNKSKYSLAQPEQVEAVLSQALANGTPATAELWEQAYKLSHEKMDALKKQWLSENIQQTKTINNKAKDTKAGGSIPGQVPQRFALKDSFKEMSKALGIE
jgi:hypothetical protein